MPQSASSLFELLRGKVRVAFFVNSLEPLHLTLIERWFVQPGKIEAGVVKA